ncbi:MAG: T9SS type A sorting domain-containing protein [Bacteroidetes bacterium]|nr:T9SS type A sorting domain-containing protein [Bacteroidota bacterium]
MNMKTLFTAITILLISTKVFSYDDLRISNPQGWWWGEQGTIEKAVVSIKPSGVYVEYGVYLTISAQNSGFSDTDQLEIIFDFELPKEAIVNDLWLWVGEDIMKAELYDKWTASTIYEGIVNRRQDPAILFKESETHYKLRVYPLLKTESRKIKLTYLVPAEWHSKSVTYSLPTNILNTSRYPLEKIDLVFWSDGSFNNPTIIEYPEADFGTEQESDLGKYYEINDLDYDKNRNLTLSVNSPLDDGVFISNYDDMGEGIYQIALLPSQFVDVQARKKVAVLIDYDASKTTVTPSSIISNLEIMLQNYLSDSDSFNVFFSGLTGKKLSDRWLNASAESIDLLAEYYNDQGINTYSNIASTIGTALEFINENGESGSIVLISSSEQIADYSVANGLIDDILETMLTDVPFQIVDITNRNYSYHYIGNNNYRGNEYLYINLSRQTSGNYFSMWEGNSFSDNISDAFSSLQGFITAFDMFTSLELGFCYNRFDITDNSLIYLNKPVIQVGKYIGTFPFELNLSGQFKNSIFNVARSVDESASIVGSEKYKQIWAGNYLKYLEKAQPTNSVTSEIVEISLANNILSLYSAFLALEPSDTTKPCWDCFDETNMVDIEDEIEEVVADTLVQAYPNPFNGEVNIKITLPQSFTNDNVSLIIYNMLGQEVFKFDPEEYNNKSVLNLRWNGKNMSGQSVSSGIYFFSMSTPKSTKSLKLIMLK